MGVGLRAEAVGFTSNVWHRVGGGDEPYRHGLQRSESHQGGGDFGRVATLLAVHATTVAVARSV